MPPVVNVGDVRFDGRRPVFILGPCVIESPEFTLEMAQALREITRRLDVPFIFKASFDKANRSSVDSFRGVGVEAGCRLLGEIGREIGVPVTTDIHLPAHAESAAEHIDLLQIPAFLCRQTDLIQAAAESGRAVNVKKGQFLAPWDMRNVAEKLRAFGCRDFLFTERGASFGYNNLVADMRSLWWMRRDGFRVVFDATHSVQRPGGLGSSSGGDGVLAPVLARAAAATGCDGIFIESHVDPSKALSDGPNQIPLSQLEAVLRQILQIHAIVADS